MAPILLRTSPVPRWEFISGTLASAMVPVFVQLLFQYGAGRVARPSSLNTNSKYFRIFQIMLFLIMFFFQFFVNEPNTKIHPDERVLLNRAVEAKKKYIAAGTDASTADQSVFKEILVPNSKLLIHECWFDIIAWIAAPEDDPLTERHKDNPWLWEFMPPRDAGVADPAPSRQFQAARSIFDLDPHGFIEALSAFEKDVHIQDVCNLLMKRLVSNAGFMRCWIGLQNDISAILENRDGNPDGEAVTIDDPLQKELSLMSSHIEKMEAVPKGLANTAKFLTRYQTITKPYENSTNTWDFKRMQRLYRVLIHQWESDSAVFFISNQVRNLCATNINIPLSAILEHFQFNVGSFYYLVTGDIEQGLSVPETLTKLRDMSLHRQQQWAPIYKIISDLRADVMKKQQIITCLGFRHVLEMLPDQPELRRHFVNPTPHGATGYWKMAWQFVVERELVLLLYEHLQFLASSGATLPAGVPVPDPPTIPASENLRKLLLYDFQEWKKLRGSKQLLIQHALDTVTQYQRLEGSYIACCTMTAAAAPGPLATPGAGAAGAAGAPGAPGAPAALAPIGILYPPAAPAVVPAAAPVPETILTALFNTLSLRYHKWNCYQRGLGLYGELSSSIHKYNKQFEVDETNWGRSDFLILK